MIASPARVRRATADDLEDLTSILAQGFFTDPTFEWMLPDVETRMQYSTGFFRIFGGVAVQAGDTFIEQDLGSAAVWLPVDPSAPSDDSELVEEIAAALGPNVERLGIIVELMQAAHPHHAAHSYLNFVSTIPARQGSGLGRAIISERLRELDVAGLPGYLEATTPRSARLYERLGFVHLDKTIDLPDGPSIYPMWREPAR